MASFTHVVTPVLSQQYSSLHVTQDSGYHTSFTPGSLCAGELCNENVDPNESHTRIPSTPLKKNCKTSCKLSPHTGNRGNRKLDFTIHSLSCESEALLARKSNCPKVARTIIFHPDIKVDIIKNLIENDIIPPLIKIFSYLPDSDVVNFPEISTTWGKVFDVVSKDRRYQINNYLKSIELNKENKNKIANENIEGHHKRQFKDITNVDQKYGITNVESHESPKIIRFKKVVKSASVGLEVKHLPCVRCRQPARMYDHLLWAECTSTSCATQFCKSCMYEKLYHIDKKCSQYGLDCLSPSKRMNVFSVGSKQSKLKLRRL